MKQFIFTISLMMVFIITPQTYTQETWCGVKWLPPVKLSPDETTGYIPKMAVQGDIVHLSFFYPIPFQLPYVRSTNGGVDWEPMRELYDTLTYPPQVGGPHFAVNGEKLYLFFHGGPYGGVKFWPYMIISSDHGSTWTNPVNLINTNDTTIQMRNVAILGDTIVISVIVIGRMWDRTLFSTDGGLTWAIGEGSIYTGAVGGVALTRNWTHEFHHKYIDGYSFEIIHQRSSNFGMTWQDSSIISTLDNWSSMVAYPLGTVENDLFVIWRDAKYGCIGFGCSGILMQSTDEGKTWLQEVVVTDTPWAMSPSISVYKPIIAGTWYTDDPNINVETNISYDYGKSWCNVFEVTPRGGDNSGFITGVSNIVITPRTVVIAYTQRDSLEKPFQIWCRTGILPETSVKDEPERLLTDYKVLPAYPNPFNSSATIEYSLPKGTDVNLSVYNILGEKVAVLANEFQNAGWQEVVWESGNNPSGVYVYRLTAGKYKSAGKLLLIK